MQIDVYPHVTYSTHAASYTPNVHVPNIPTLMRCDKYNLVTIDDLDGPVWPVSFV